ncbi:hypothetical protein HU200_062058 [Digitaria exilis]|uniref:Uncharacterized protein n=1 Tax=Digitaria exilis TaxID=1010633 RepID=A0A835DXM0_9POAL|nr:hypothetical protein HU200_062058 [Digitaria exilis]
MLKFLSKVVVEYCPLDPRKVATVELLAQCNSRKAKDSNPSCSPPPRVLVTYPNGVEEAIVITEGDTAQGVRDQIIARGRLIDTELLFRNGGEEWPVVIPEEELRMPFPGIKVKTPLSTVGSCTLFSNETTCATLLVLGIRIVFTGTWPHWMITTLLN